MPTESPPPTSPLGGGSEGVIHTDNPVFHALPANVTFLDLIRANKRKSAMLMFGMGLLVVLIGTVLGTVAMLGFGSADVDTPMLILVMLGSAGVSSVVAVGSAAWSFYGGSNAILKMSGARPIEKQQDPQLYNVVEELSIAAGIPLPQVYLIDDSALNAFATGRDPEHAAVAITSGLRQHLNRDELAAVMAHEISHIRHYDIRFAMLMATMVGLIVFACDAFWQMMRYNAWFGGGSRSRSRRSSGGGKGDGGAAVIMLVLVVVAVILAIVAPTVAMLIRFAVSRQREFLADAGAVELTRYPQGMIGALEKLGGCREPLEVANRATAHLYVVNPMKSAMKGEGHEMNSAFRTHPPLHDRIARLQALLSPVRNTD